MNGTRSVWRDLPRLTLAAAMMGCAALLVRAGCWMTLRADRLWGNR